MPKLKLEKVTGAVALAYLVLIPAGAFYAWQKIRAIDSDLNEVWVKVGMPQSQTASGVDTFFRRFRGR